MQIDDLSILDKPSKINDPCLQKVIEWERCLDSIEFVRAPKSKPPVGIPKIRGRQKKPNRTESNRINRTETDSNRTEVHFKPFG